MVWRFGDDYAATTESLSGDAPRSPCAQWAGGLLVPVLLAALGISFCLSREGFFPSGEDDFISLTGKAAVAMGVSFISAGAFLHFHYFWGNVNCLGGVSPLAKTLAVLCFLVSFVYAIWTVAAG